MASVRILLTNDDGIDAPGLLPFARALSGIGEVAVVVPDRERSWVGKAITRFDPVHVAERTVDGITVFACTGYPADCVQLGLNGVLPERPELVLSGVNIGYNCGAAYLQSSGTAGAALEAGIARVPAIAFSTGSGGMPWAEWKRWILTPEAMPVWERVSIIAAGIAIEAFPHMVPGEVLNVGIPDDADDATERRITRVAEVGYARLFAEQSPGVYTHAYGDLVTGPDGLDGTDVEAAREGVISVTAIRGAGNGPASNGVLEALARS